MRELDRSLSHPARAGGHEDAPGGGLLAAVGRRMSGPGGYYNLGNLLGLAVSIGVPLAVGRDAGSTLAETLVGNPGAAAISCAILIFFASGEMYYRAWARDGDPDPFLNGCADLVSGIGSLALGFGLLMFGHPFLAASAGCLLAFGKFGSAFRQLRGGTVPAWPASWPDPFRSAVVAGRFPAVLTSGADFWTMSLFVLAGGSSLTLLTPGVMLVCQLLWVKADLLLLWADEAEDRAPRFPGAPSPQTRP